MLRYLGRCYRNQALGLVVEHGEVLRDLSPDLEAWLQRDTPGLWEPYEDPAPGGEKAAEAPPRDKMMDRERALRKASESGAGPVMDSGSHSALVRGGPGGRG